MAEGQVTVRVSADTADAEKRISQVGDAAEDAGKEAESAGSKAFSKVEKGARSAEGESDGLGDAAKAAGKEAEAAGSGAFGEVAEGARDAAGEVDGLSALVGGITTALSVDAVVGGMQDLAETASEARVQTGRLAVAAEQSGTGADAASAAYRDMVGVLGETDQSVEAVNHLFTMCGDNAQALASWTDVASGVFATFGDSLPIEGLTEAANESSRVGSVVGPLADALNWASMSTEEWSASLAAHPEAQAAFNQAVADGAGVEDAFTAALSSSGDQAERAQMITEALTGAYGEAGRQYQETNGDVIAYNQAQDDLSGAMTDLGTAVMPLVTGATSMLADAIAWAKDNASWLVPVLAGVGTGLLGLMVIGTVTSLVQALSSGVGVLNAVLNANPIVLVATALAALAVALVTAYNTNEEFRAAVNAAWEWIVSTLGGFVDSVVRFFTEDVPGAIEAMQEWFANLPGNIKTWIDQAAQNVAAWVSDMVAKARQVGSDFLNAVVSFFQQLPYNVGYLIGYVLAAVVKWVSDMVAGAQRMGSEFLSAVVSFFQQLPGRVWGFLTQAASSAASWVVDMAGKAASAGSQFVGNVASFLSGLPGRVWGFLSSAIGNAASFVSSFASKAADAGSRFLSNIVSELQAIPGRVFSIGQDIVRGIANGITSLPGLIGDKLRSMAQGAIDGVKGFLGIHSPSRVFRDQVGRWIPLGMAEGVEDEAGAYRSAVDDALGYLPDVDISRDLTASMAYPSPASVSQTVNFYQPVETPAQVLQAARHRELIGLAGA